MMSPWTAALHELLALLLAKDVDLVGDLADDEHRDLLDQHNVRDHRFWHGFGSELVSSGWGAMPRALSRVV